MDVKEAAKKLGVHTQTVYNMLNDGRLKGTKGPGGVWDISDEQIEELLSDSTKHMKEATDLYAGIMAVEEVYENQLKGVIGRIGLRSSDLAESIQEGYGPDSLNHYLSELKKELETYESLLKMRTIINSVYNQARELDQVATEALKAAQRLTGYKRKGKE